MKSYLPDEIAQDVAGKARETYALAALDTAYTLLTKHKAMGAITQIKEALKFSHSFRVIWRTIRMLIALGVSFVRR
jgi:hypothetical protein